MSADIVGVFDPELLRQCAAALLARHPNLRASFFHGDLSRPVQVVPTRVDVPWRIITATADEVDALDADERLRPFDLERGPAIRFLLIEVADGIATRDRIGVLWSSRITSSSTAGRCRCSSAS